MKQLFCIVLTMMFATIHVPGSGAASEKTATIDKDEQTGQALAAVKTYADNLKAALKKGMKEGGAVKAISVCNTRAEAIAKDVSAQQGLSIGRVSLKNRNPDNAPNPWQQKVLEDFENRKRAGEPVSELTFVEVAETGTGRQFRFMKAIPTKGLCLACHGTRIAPEVAAELNRLYPNDRARGFQAGDIRGAFVVTRDIPR